VWLKRPSLCRPPIRGLKFYSLSLESAPRGVKTLAIITGTKPSRGGAAAGVKILRSVSDEPVARALLSGWRRTRRVAFMVRQGEDESAWMNMVIGSPNRLPDAMWNAEAGGLPAD